MADILTTHVNQYGAAPRAARLKAAYPDAAEMLLEAEGDVLAYKQFPSEHWRRIHSTNPLERINKELRRRIRVVGLFPDRPSTLRLVGTLLKEQDDDWRGSARKYFNQDSMRLVTRERPTAEEAAETFLTELTAVELVEA